MSQNYHQDWEALLGPADDPVLYLSNQLFQDGEGSNVEEETLRQQAFFGVSSLTESQLPSQESLLDDPVVLAALLMDKGL